MDKRIEYLAAYIRRLESMGIANAKTSVLEGSNTIVMKNDVSKDSPLVLTIFPSKSDDKNLVVNLTCLTGEVVGRTGIYGTLIASTEVQLTSSGMGFCSLQTLKEAQAINDAIAETTKQLGFTPNDTNPSLKLDTPKT